MSHHEVHRVHRVGWLRAAVLGANDGIVSTASLIIGVAAASTTHENILLAGVAGLVAGAMSMAAGEYVSVSSQSDTENADLALEQQSLEDDFDAEKEELAMIYQDRGLEPVLAVQVAEQLMAHDALGAHARDSSFFGGHFCRWGSTSVDRGMGDAGTSTNTAGSCFVSRIPGYSWRSRGTHGRRGDSCGRDQSDFLGRACNGTYGRSRALVRRCCLKIVKQESATCQ
jgi:hypothetical protein